MASNLETVDSSEKQRQLVKQLIEIKNKTSFVSFTLFFIELNQEPIFILG